MKQVYVVRHGQTEWNALNLLQGSADIPLAPEGRAQAERAADVLARLVGDDATVITSPLERARDTARALADRLDVEVHVDERLRERAYGVWEGITPEDRQQRWPDAVERWHAHGDPQIPGFENHARVKERMVASLEDWADRAPATLVAFSHGSCSRVGVMGLLGLSLEHRTLGNLGNTAWIRLTRRARGEWTLERLGVTADTCSVMP